ncbi:MULTISPECIES: hypothetical protein [unclassified Microcoleus]|uniref:hypothetical protein n=2 Tax=Microcoleus TaxID=44471 RepID=UPI0025D9210A|nr:MULTISPECIES: hypothetical protein [unclassified Microcoleus]
MMFWERDRAYILQQSVISRNAEVTGHLLASSSRLTQQLAIVALAINVKRARLCKDFTKISG